MRKGDIAADFWAKAAGYCVSIERLIGDDGDNSTNGIHSPAIFVLLGFTVEFCLKAILADAGLSKDRLQHEFGHDLKKAFREIERSGIAIKTRRVDELVKRLHKAHKTAEFRYPSDRDNFLVPEAVESLKILSGLVVELAPRFLDRIRD